MGKSASIGISVVVMTAIFAIIALPEIVDRLYVTQASASGITGPLDLAITNLSYVLPLGIVALLGAVLMISLRR
tara:strand:+ start:592 stop:813 length:222 start_codon:yes stop_codon:yes gene_type:complete